MPPSSPPPPLLDSAALQGKSVELCQKHVEQALEGEYVIEPLEPNLEWDPIALRQVYEQPMVIWRAYAGYEVLFDALDRPVGFVDEDKWLRCVWCELPAAEAEALARATGFVPGSAVLAESIRGERDCLELVFASALAGEPRTRVRINPKRKAVISVEPEVVAP